MLERKKLVCHVVNRLEVGGLENGVVNICNRLDRERFEPMICCIRGLGAMAKRVNSDVRIINLNYRDGPSFLRPFQMACFFLREKPDIVHTHAWGMGSFESIIGARLAGVPIIINGEHGSFFTKRYQLYFQKLLVLFTDQILAVSESLKKEIVAIIGVSPARINVILNGVDVQLFNGMYNYSKIVKENIIKQYLGDGHSNKFIVGCVGSLRKQKNQIMLLRALKKINTNNLNNSLRLVFIGDGPDRSLLEKYVFDNGMKNQVVFLGVQHDLKELYGIMDLLASTSVSGYEGLSNVILEGMASGVPVIATKSVGTSEIITDDYNGFLVDADDIAALSEKIKLLEQDNSKLNKIRCQARKIIDEKFSLDAMVLSYQKIYDKCLKKKGL